MRKRKHGSFQESNTAYDLDSPNGYVPFDDKELVPTCPPAENPSDTVTLNGIADLLQAHLQPVSNINHLQESLSTLNASYDDFKTAVQERLRNLEQHMDLTDARVANLEKLCEPLQVEAGKVEQKIART